MAPIRVTVWCEHQQDKRDAPVMKIYPKGMHTAIAGFLNKQKGIRAVTATLEEPEHGLTEERLAQTDVLTWWGHVAHGAVRDDIVERVKRRVLDGMGLIVLHSSHVSKIFRALMGTHCSLRWREVNEKERLWVIEPSHPIAQGLPESFVLPHHEMYGERFDIPTPDALVFISWYEGGDVFRSGCCWERGFGRVFYFSPGHESHPIYKDKNIQKVITNAVHWAVPRLVRPNGNCPNVTPLEKIRSK